MAGKAGRMNYVNKTSSLLECNAVKIGKQVPNLIFMDPCIII
jgi:hypothetical protein